MFIDSIQISKADLQKYNPNDIASVTVYKDDTRFKHLASNADGAIYIETKQFSRKRFLNYFKSKSPKFKNLLTKTKLIAKVKAPLEKFQYHVFRYFYNFNVVAYFPSP